MIIDFCIDVAEAVKAVKWRLQHRCRQCKYYLPMVDCDTCEVRCYGLCCGCGEKKFNRLGHWPAVMMEQPACRRFEMHGTETQKHSIIEEYGLPFAD